jgi:3-methyladenine DNA glycosylase AlkC
LNIEDQIMPERLKDIFFANAFIEQLGQAIGQIYPNFDQKEFTRLVYDDAWTARELKAKMRHLTRCLRATLPEDYPQALAILVKVAPSFNGFDALVFPDYVECYGMDEWDLSMPALAVFTQQGSSEYAVRPFLLKDPQRALAYMYTWAEAENHHLRRLASEGCRPRLPWGMALPAFKKDPSLILPILEKLKADESDYVRKSVANNLNDISKDHPDLMLDICTRWYGVTNQTDWIVKHACRGLLKAGNERALRLFGFAGPMGLSIANLTLDKAALAIGETLGFTFELSVEAAAPQQVRLEYKVYFVKASGKFSPKVFQIWEGLFDPGSHLISRKHSFEDRTTRRHHPGPHQIAIVVNGVEMVTASFDLG